MPLQSSEKLLKSLAVAADDKKALNICAYQLKNPAVTDFALIVSAKNPIHIKALFKDLDQAASEYLKENPDVDFFQHPKVSGSAESGWIILDLNAIMVHILSVDIRQFYELDTLFEQRAVAYHF